MKLPTITVPKYNVTIPTSGKNVSFRPFLVKEEKALLMSLESEDVSNIINSLKDTITNCTFGVVDPETLPLAEMCFLFLNIRAKSVGETAEPALTCMGCEETNFVEVDLTSLDIVKNENHSKKLDIGDGKGIIMKYPTLAMESHFTSQVFSPDNLNFAAECIDSIYDGDNVYKHTDYSLEELVEFLESLTHSQFEKVLEFFETMPKLQHSVEFKCEKCGMKNTALLEGIRDFFL
ncbi:MAG: baseplate protein [Proteobacteria bacterium]|nr:baseplate protein [Pseudomonadota bacterium]